MITLYLLLAAGALALSWRRYRAVFHPHFLLTVVLVVMFTSDFIIRGYDEEDTELLSIHPEDLIEFQIVILVLSGAIIWLAHLLVKRERFVFEPPRLDEMSARQWIMLVVPAYLVVLLDLLKRLWFAGWNPLAALEFSIAARGSAPWSYAAGNLGDENFVFALFGSLSPFSGVVFGAMCFSRNALFRYLGIASLCVWVLLSLSEGGRTHIVFVLGATLMFAIARRVHTFRKFTVAAIIGVLIAFTTSLLYLFRSGGLIQLTEAGATSEFHLLYHQDNTYFQLLRVFDIATNSSERWSVFPFVEAVLVNPIPRYFWSDKPALLSEYWGSFKEEWITISFVGELVAMFGPIGGALTSIPVALLLFWLLVKAAPKKSSSEGILLYVFVALYLYMCFRSLLNISQFIYLPLFAWAMNRIGHVSSDRERTLLASPRAR